MMPTDDPWAFCMSGIANNSGKHADTEAMHISNAAMAAYIAAELAYSVATAACTAAEPFHLIA